MSVQINFRSNKDDVIKLISQAVPPALNAIGIQAVSNAKTELTKDPVRVDTGRLRNSITHAVQDDSVYIGTNVEYAIYVHEGTRKMAPNRFLANAIRNNVDEYKAIAEKYMKDA